MLQQPMFRDTIFALSSGHLPSGVAVIRISGSAVRSVLAELAGGAPDARRAELRAFNGPDGLIDRGLVLFFPGPASFTGEDCAEFHLHGGKAVVSKMLQHLGARAGMRMAEAGEFTKRAFINGKIDLTGAEALADLVNAETETQRRMAISNAEGAQHELYSAWHGRLLQARALVEAELDFADESDVPGSVADRVWRDMAGLAEEIRKHSEGYRITRMIRDGFRVAIVGAPNAGKSSLLNALARRDAAIVSSIPGTTRDLVEVVLDLNGVKVIVADTAGIRTEGDEVELIGIERALRAAADADLTIELSDATRAQVPLDINLPAERRLSVLSKIDLVPESRHRASALAISTVTGEGLEALEKTIADRAAAALGTIGEALPSRLRHVELLETAFFHLNEAAGDEAAPLELRAEQLRLAADRLGSIIGTVSVEDVLGAIFSQFCIGK